MIPARCMRASLAILPLVLLLASALRAEEKQEGWEITAGKVANEEVWKKEYERKHKEWERGKEWDSETGQWRDKGKEEEKEGTKIKATVFEASTKTGDSVAVVDKQASVGDDKNGAKAGLELLKAGYEVEAKGGVYYVKDKDGNWMPAAGVELGAKGELVLARVSVDAKGQYGSDLNNVHGSAEANAAALAEAEAKLKLTVDRENGLKGDLGVEGFAGGKAEGEVTAGFTFLGVKVDLTAKGEVSAGIGGKAGIDFQISPTGKIYFSAGAAATLGIGAGAQFGFSIDASELMKRLGITDPEQLRAYLQRVLDAANAVAGILYRARNWYNGTDEQPATPTPAEAGKGGYNWPEPIKKDWPEPIKIRP